MHAEEKWSKSSISAYRPFLSRSLPSGRKRWSRPQKNDIMVPRGHRGTPKNKGQKIGERDIYCIPGFTNSGHKQWVSPIFFLNLFPDLPDTTAVTSGDGCNGYLCRRRYELSLSSRRCKLPVIAHHVESRRRNQRRKLPNQVRHRCLYRQIPDLSILSHCLF